MLYVGPGGKKLPLQQVLQEFNRIVEPRRCCHFHHDGARCPHQGSFVDPETGHLICLEHTEVDLNVH